MKPAHRYGEVAIEPTTSYQSYLNLDDQLGGWKFTNGAPVTERLRIIKGSEEISLIREAIAACKEDKIPSFMSDRWLSDVTLYGSATEVRDGIEAWRAAGVNTPISVPASTKGGQMAALHELLELYR